MNKSPQKMSLLIQRCTELKETMLTLLTADIGGDGVALADDYIVPRTYSMQIYRTKSSCFIRKPHNHGRVYLILYFYSSRISFFSIDQFHSITLVKYGKFHSRICYRCYRFAIASGAYSLIGPFEHQQHFSIMK